MPKQGSSGVGDVRQQRTRQLGEDCYIAAEFAGGVAEQWRLLPSTREASSYSFLADSIFSVADMLALVWLTPQPSSEVFGLEDTSPEGLVSKRAVQDFLTIYFVHGPLRADL